MKSNRRNAQELREAFYRYRQELSDELGVFYEPKSNDIDEQGIKILNRMIKREKKHRQKG
ncbi:MAG: hypothetical protein IJG50_01640 [Clostridia bacterium]|nr:hypothetical protein [Clostridia bacterium]